MTVIAAPWTEQALCLGEDPETFFPVSEAGPGLEQVVRAKAICQTCPVVRECLTHALDTGESAGIWGGATPEERRLLRRSGRMSGTPNRLFPAVELSEDLPPPHHPIPDEAPRGVAE